MPILRLKKYTQEIYNHYLDLSDEPKETDEDTLIGKRLRASYAASCQTVLFFNQSIPNMSLVAWCDNTPVSYLLEIDHFISLLEDSTRWAISSIGMEEQPQYILLNQRIIHDMNILRISDLPESADAITTQFEQTCHLIHTSLPDNLRKRKALMRLIWAYLSAKELTLMARELANCDRINYLRKLTKY